MVQGRLYKIRDGDVLARSKISNFVWPLEQSDLVDVHWRESLIPQTCLLCLRKSREGFEVLVGSDVCAIDRSVRRYFFRVK